MTVAVAPPTSSDELAARIETLLPSLRELRHEFHRHPEIAYEERWTSQRILKELEEIGGLDIRTGLAETGIVAVLGKEKTGPAVALRADIDALPLDEESGVEWSSETPGRMHACGHDGHATMLLGAVKILSEIREELAGPVVFIFQPAEEGGAGAEKMLNEGALDDPPVAAIYGTHNYPHLDYHLGQIATRTGPIAAASGMFTIQLQGRGGHAAAPHRCVDPVYVGSQIVQALQGLVSRVNDPQMPLVISVTRFTAGTTHNIIPDSAELAGTWRTLDWDQHIEMQQRITDLVKATAEAHGATATLDMDPGYPVLPNDARSTRLFLDLARESGLSPELIDADCAPMMGGEDFAYFARAVPGTFWFLCSRPKDISAVPFCHHPKFDFNDDIIAQGVRLHVEVARHFAQRWSKYTPTVS